MTARRCADSRCRRLVTENRLMTISKSNASSRWDLALERVRQRHRNIYLLVAPPRSGSTALARVFWEHPEIGHYCHEPFDAVYYKKGGLDSAGRALQHAVTVGGLGNEADPVADDLVIKEMTFQVGPHLPRLAAATTHPLVFLLRDPRSCIASRMKCRLQGGQDPLFPLYESGWEALAAQVALCRSNHLPYVMVDSTELRNQPEAVLTLLFESLDLSFSSAFLRWRPVSSVQLGSLKGEQDHWYERVLRSRTLQPEPEPPPSVDSFVRENGFREHVKECMDIYRDLRRDDHMITATRHRSAATRSG